MEEVSRYAVGIDVGTENVRAVVLNPSKDGFCVVGYGEAKNAGMRKGVVANLMGPGEAIDRMLADVERMSNFQVDQAYISVNGTHVSSVKTTGMIAVGMEGQAINREDVMRVSEAAVTGRIPANREVLAVLPLEYNLDGQGGIRDPLGMIGSRLEINANVISALAPNCNNLRKAVTEVAKVATEKLVPVTMADGRAVLTERQMENGVAVIDLGATTTSVAVYEEGDLQYIGVIPVGANNITNDLAICLKIDTETAEDIKMRYVTADFMKTGKDIVVKRGREEIMFERGEVDEIVKARLVEIFESVIKQLKAVHYERRLPEGAVLVGGGAKMRGIEEFAREILQMAVKIGSPIGMTGMTEAVSRPEYAAAVGLAMMMAENEIGQTEERPSPKKNRGFLKKILKKF